MPGFRAHVCLWYLCGCIANSIAPVDSNCCLMRQMLAAHSPCTVLCAQHGTRRMNTNRCINFAQIWHHIHHAWNKTSCEAYMFHTSGTPRSVSCPILAHSHINMVFVEPLSLYDPWSYLIISCKYPLAQPSSEDPTASKAMDALRELEAGV